MMTAISETSRPLGDRAQKRPRRRPTSIVAVVSVWIGIAMVAKAAHGDWEVKSETNPFDKTSTVEMAARSLHGLPVILSLGCTLHGYIALTVVTEKYYKAPQEVEIFNLFYQVKVDDGEPIGLQMQAYETKNHQLAYRSSKGTTDAVKRVIEKVKTAKDVVALRPVTPYAPDSPGAIAIFMTLPVSGIEIAAIQLLAFCKN